MFLMHRYSSSQQVFLFVHFFSSSVFFLLRHLKNDVSFENCAGERTKTTSLLNLQIQWQGHFEIHLFRKGRVIKKKFMIDSQRTFLTTRCVLSAPNYLLDLLVQPSKRIAYQAEIPLREKFASTPKDQRIIER